MTPKQITARSEKSKIVHSIFDAIQIAVSQGASTAELLKQLEEACK